MVPRILVFAASLLLASCASQLPDRRPALDDPSNPHAPESAARSLQPTLAAQAAPEMEESPPQAPMHHHHHGGKPSGHEEAQAPDRDGVQVPEAKAVEAPPSGGGK